MFRDLRDRGLEAPKLLAADGIAGLWAAVGEIWPTIGEQRCWNHKIVNVLDQLPRKLQAVARETLCAIPYATRRRSDRPRPSIVVTSSSRIDCTVSWIRVRTKLSNFSHIGVDVTGTTGVFFFMATLLPSGFRPGSWSNRKVTSPLPLYTPFDLSPERTHSLLS